MRIDALRENFETVHRNETMGGMPPTIVTARVSRKDVRVPASTPGSRVQYVESPPHGAHSYRISYRRHLHKRIQYHHYKFTRAVMGAAMTSGSWHEADD
jgi:hypothetical protein